MTIVGKNAIPWWNQDVKDVIRGKNIICLQGFASEQTFPKRRKFLFVAGRWT